MMTPDDEDKTKLKNFLETLLRLARDQSDSLAQSVRSLIQVQIKAIGGGGICTISNE